MEQSRRRVCATVQAPSWSAIQNDIPSVAIGLVLDVATLTAVDLCIPEAAILAPQIDQTDYRLALRPRPASPAAKSTMISDIARPPEASIWIWLPGRIAPVLAGCRDYATIGKCRAVAGAECLTSQ